MEIGGALRRNEVQADAQGRCRDFCSLQHVHFRAFAETPWLPEDSDDRRSEHTDDKTRDETEHAEPHIRLLWHARSTEAISSQEAARRSSSRGRGRVARSRSSLATPESMTLSASGRERPA